VRPHAAVGRALGSRAGENLAAARDGVARMEQLCRSLAMPGLASFGVAPTAFPDLILRARRTSSMRANPAELDDARMTTILERSLAPGTPAL
jgi:alcohol dehydrogenase class IV